MQPSSDVRRLLDIMAALRAPRSGCAWDLAQSFETIAPYTIEEAYEVADAVSRGDLSDLKDELGDLLLQVVFHARMAQEQDAFDFGDVVDAICAKMIRRHPHIFGDVKVLSAQEIETQWARIKAEEKAARAGPAAREKGVLDGVALALPALTRAVKLQQKASGVGFDWNDPRAVLAKIREETDEIEAEIPSASADAMEDEIGDLLFAVANLARHLNVDPEAAARRANAKFMRRFRHIETELARRGLSPEQAGLAAMDALWDDAKAREKADRG
ncbi:nucleoside triphosphate pyrophosphohydrolase [Methylocella sp.]|uniref:nucleoside triphosphate pyrophosphohydrolase n=1 Tax=Methylocella sp. TaxID=1978226 RepID=UPI003783A077